MTPDERILFSSRKVIYRVSNLVKCLIPINSQNSAFQQEITFSLYFSLREKFALIVQELLILEKNQESFLSLFITKSWWVTHKWLTFYVFFFLIL